MITYDDDTNICLCGLRYRIIFLWSAARFIYGAGQRILIEYTEWLSSRNYTYLPHLGKLKLVCSACRVITTGKNCFENIHERLNSMKMKYWYTTKTFISTEQ